MALTKAAQKKKLKAGALFIATCEGHFKYGAIAAAGTEAGARELAVAQVRRNMHPHSETTDEEIADCVSVRLLASGDAEEL